MCRSKNLLALSILPSLILAACNPSGSGGGRGGLTGGTGEVGRKTPGPKATPNREGTPSTAIEIKADALEIAKLPPTVAGSTLQCTTIGFTLTKGGEKTKDLSVAFALVADETGKDTGTVVPAEVKTDANGVVKTKYCSGKDPIHVTITATVETIQANSGKITVAESAPLTLTYVSNDRSAPKDKMKRHLFGMGPIDCGTMTFSVTKEGAPAANAEGHFNTSGAVPNGFKFAAKGESGMFSRDAYTNAITAILIKTSDANGMIQVPVCAGDTPGDVALTGFVQADGLKSDPATIPMIEVVSALAAHERISVQYDPANARVAPALFESDSTETLKFKVNLGASRDGQPVQTNPIRVYSETGRVLASNGGVPDANGVAEFSFQALHAGNNPPYRYFEYLASSGPNPQSGLTRCDPEALLNESWANVPPGRLPADLNKISYRDLQKNWRNSITIIVRGQEGFYDKNHNGVFDVNTGDGFWDKNQDGYFTSGIDQITFDYRADTKFDYNSEWFIDLPTPFIDVDEDRAYDPLIDRLAGTTTYTAPNGAWDADTNIWKTVQVAYNFGTSPYAMTTDQIPRRPGSVYVTPAFETGYFTDLISRGYTRIGNPKNFFADITNNDLFPDLPSSTVPSPPPTTAAKLSGSLIQRYLFAHNICGGPVPGGTAVNAIISDQMVSYGDRAITTHFYVQPSDDIRENSRRLLNGATGASTGTIGSDTLDHPSAASGYPVVFTVEIAACRNACSGDVETNNPGYACGAKSAILNVGLGGDTWPNDIEFGATEIQCNCVAGASQFQATCTCPTGTTSNGTACVTPP